MAQKFQVGDRVVNRAYPQDGPGTVVYAEADRYSLENWHYGVAWDKYGDNAPAIPFDNHHPIEKVTEAPDA